MAAVINKSDLILAATSPRLATVNLGSTVNVNGTVNSVPAATLTTDVNTAVTHSTSTGNPHGATFAQIAGDLDDIADGTTFYRTTLNQGYGASRAYNALDNSNEYVKTLTSSKLTIAGAAPSTGWVGDFNGIRMYQSGVLKVNIPVSGNPYFDGDLNISGTATFNGSTSDSGNLTALLSNTSRNRPSGIRSYSGSSGGNGVYGNADNASGTGYGGFFRRQGGSNGAALIGESSTGASGVIANNTSSGYALEVNGPMYISTSALVSRLNAERWNGNTCGSTTNTGSSTATFVATNKPGSSGSNVWWSVVIDGITRYIPCW